jgi:hypothetical protein
MTEVKKYKIILKTEDTEQVFYVHKKEFDKIENILFGVTK